MKKNTKSCEGCNGACCRYVSVEIDVPEELKDFEEIKWFVIHKGVYVYVDEDDCWYIEFSTPCRYLENNKCSIYEKRPNICKEYNHDECTFHNEYSEKFTFKTLEDVEKYIKEVFEKGKHVIPKDEN